MCSGIFCRYPQALAQAMSGVPMDLLVKIAQTRVEHEAELTRLFLKNFPPSWGEAEVRGTPAIVSRASHPARWTRCN